MHRSLPAHVLFAATALLAASPALALSTVTSTLADFHIALTDLDPTDGVAPTLTLDPQSRSTVIPSEISVRGTKSWMQQGDSAFGSVSSSGDLDGTGGSASFAGDPFGAGAEIAASATGDTPLDVGASEAYVNAPPFGQGAFVLGPQTEVTFFGSVSIDWSASDVGAATYGEVDLSFWRIVGADVDFVAYGNVTGGYYGEGRGALTGSTSNSLAITFDNDSDASVDMGYQVAVFANASEIETLPPPPVDEPAGVALLLAGVATVLWGVRRRG